MGNLSVDRAPGCRTRCRLAALLLLTGLALALGSAAPAVANSLDRDRDPVILTGAALPALAGAAPSRIVAYRWQGGWVQIPAQVDERAVVDFGTIYGSSPSGFTLLTYADSSTFTGADPDPAFDPDDELVIMAADAGDRAPGAAEPAGAIAATGVELRIDDPVGGGSAWAYLFPSDGSLDPGAGAHRVSYDFTLLSGDYRTTYRTAAGPNPEDSWVVTPAYRVHFADRWIRNAIEVTAGGATGADILDRHKSLFAPGTCTRSETTFSNGEGAFIVNREGPLRALRGYVGANSGPTTWRLHAFYEAREDVLTALRVHPISGIMDFFDYSPAASGMIYRDDLNTGGVTVDGVPDVIAAGPFGWEMVTGEQGTLAMATSIATDIPGFGYTHYYLDDSTPPVTQCTGDAYAYGSSGFWRNGAIPNTDPALGSYYRFEATRVIAFADRWQSSAFAAEVAQDALHPLETQVSPYAPATSVAATGDDRPGVEAVLRVKVHPNPVRDVARLTLELMRAGSVEIRVVDAGGRAVATFPLRDAAAGRSELEWDARDNAPGIYFIVAKVSDAGTTGGAAAVTRVARVR